MPDVITSNGTKSVINRLWAEQKPTIRATTRSGFSVGFAISRDHIPRSAGLCVTVAGSQTSRKPIQRAAQDWSLERPRSVALAATSLIMSALRDSVVPPLAGTRHL